MNSRFHWKIIIAFVVTPILSLGLFSFIYNLALKSTDPVPTAVFVFMGIFGVLGIWLLLILILRAKRLKIGKDEIIIKRLFIFKEFKYLPTDIITYSISLRQENPFFEYEILQFKTKDKQTHSIISYEFKQYDKILTWVSRTKAKKVNFEMSTFLRKEYGLPLLIGLLTVAISIIHLQSK